MSRTTRRSFIGGCLGAAAAAGTAWSSGRAGEPGAFAGFRLEAVGKVRPRP